MKKIYIQPATELQQMYFANNICKISSVSGGTLGLGGSVPPGGVEPM
jgi:hypothetical protein